MVTRPKRSTGRGWPSVRSNLPPGPRWAVKLRRRRRDPVSRAQKPVGASTKHEAGKFPDIEKGLVRIFGRPWGGSSEFMPRAEAPDVAESPKKKKSKG
jgi:hypothetical protein